MSCHLKYTKYTYIYTAYNVLVINLLFIIYSIPSLNIKSKKHHSEASICCNLNICMYSNSVFNLFTLM